MRDRGATRGAAAPASRGGRVLQAGARHRAAVDAPTFEQVRGELRRFVEERAWDAFHTPKDLAMGVSVEAAELLEVFQWRHLTVADLTPEDRRRIADELADVVMYAMLLADKSGVDLLRAVQEKLEENRRKYPVEKAKGRAVKYDRL